MSKSKNKKVLFVVCGVIFLGGIAVFGATFIGEKKDPPGQIPAEISQSENLRTFIKVANTASGTQSGAAFNYTFVETKKNAANFGILKCRDEVRCDSVVQKEVAVWQQPNTPSPDTVEIDTLTNKVISLHRTVPVYDQGGDLPQAELENKVHEFLATVYPEFASIESTLTFDPGIKGVRLNNGNNFYRWNDEDYVLPDGLSTDVQPFIQVSITASGFIFGYDNTLDLYRSAMAEL